jgi:Uma2 family endonuclease
MASTRPRILLRLAYAEAAQEYLRSLPPEHFMEATAQATQRKITLESLDLVHARRPDVQVFNELLVQYELPGPDRPGQVVPDSMVVVWPEPIKAQGSFDVPIEPAGPLLVLEYVSNSNKRKEYDDNMRKYERELKVPYYLLFYPDGQKLTVYRRGKGKYVSVKPNEDGRLAIPELELEVALLDEWVRYWFRGELLPPPADLQRDLDEARRQLAQLQGQLDREREARLALERELDQLRGRRPGL